MKNFFFQSFTLICTSFLFLMQGISAQHKSTPIMLENRNFKKLIDRTINFTVPLLSVENLRQHKEDYIILDAREMKEFEVSHIPGASYIGYDEPRLDILDELPKDKKIVFYCSIGYRSEKIGEKAMEKGFEEVYNLYGSIFEWVNKGYELEDSKGKPTKNIHGYNWLWGRWIQNQAYQKVY